MPTKKQPKEDPPDAPVETLKSELRDKEIKLEGQDETLDEYKKQVEQIAYTLGVANDYPAVKGEIAKLIRVEDDNTELRRQIRKLEDNIKSTVGARLLKLKARLRKRKELIIRLKDDNQRLKSRKQLDRNETVDLQIEVFRRISNRFTTSLENIPSKIKNFLKLILREIKGGDN